MKGKQEVLVQQETNRKVKVQYRKKMKQLQFVENYSNAAPLSQTQGKANGKS